jgi:fructosamine-3-kinase
MNQRAAIIHALAVAGLPGGIKSTQTLSGGCIHQALLVTLADGRKVVAKINAASMLKMFEEEADGLRALAATATVLVPEPLVVAAHEETAILLMTEIEAAERGASEQTWRRFGEELAALHNANVGDRYGFPRDNHIGSTPQPNSWCDDWVQFNATHRLGFQLKLARGRGVIAEHEARRIEQLIRSLDQFIPRRPKPCLLHGDLWSGNALAAKGGRIALIDPACSIGDGWADIAMMELFGGFPATCLQSYRAARLDPDGASSDERIRIAVYQLYHVLNHVNLFGRGYVNQAMALVAALLQRS